MSKVILAVYDAKRHALRLSEPLAGVNDNDKVRVAIELEAAEGPRRPWTRHRGTFDEESGRQIAAAIREAFGREEIEV